MANPLTLLLPIIPGTSVLTLSNELSADIPELYSALQSIGTVHYARAVFLDTSNPALLPANLLSSGPFVIAIITEYDGSFDQYINDFVSTVGNVFNQVLQFVVGGAALIPVANNVAAFQAFLQAHDASQQPPNNTPPTLAQAYTATVQQILAALPSTAAAAPTSTTASSTSATAAPTSTT